MTGVDKAAAQAFVDAIAAEHETEVTPDLADAAEGVLARLALEGWFLVNALEASEV